MTKKYIYLITVVFAFLGCSYHRENKTVEKLKIDTVNIKSDFLNIIRSYCLSHPDNNSITVYSKLFVEGSEGLCADSEDPYTYYIIGPSIKDIFVDKNEHQIAYPTRWFMMEGKNVFIQSGQDEILMNEKSNLFYKSNYVAKENLRTFMRQAWLIKTTRDDKCLIVSQRLSDYMRTNSYSLKTPLKFKSQ